MDWRLPPKLPSSYWKLRRVGQVFSAILILSVFTSAYFMNTYFDYPSQPSPAEGKVVGVLIKGGRSLHHPSRMDLHPVGLLYVGDIGCVARRRVRRDLPSVRPRRLQARYLVRLIRESSG